jgi:cell division protein FtsN
MKMNSDFISCASLVVLIACLGFTFQVHANRDVQKIVDSYVIAKADNPQVKDEDLKRAPYTIQVASYINEKDAASHVEELKIQERVVRYIPAFIRGQVWYKVCVGQFETQEAAEAYRRSFIERVDEPYATVISILDRPSSATTKVVAKKTVIDAVKNPMTVTNSKGANEAEDTYGTREPASVGMHYSLQIGAFESEKIAYEHLVALPIRNQYTSIKPAQVKGKTWYRVLVGQFKNRSSAEAFQKELSEKSQGLESFVRKVSKN